LSAILAEEEEEKPRLYSKGFKDRVPVDEVAPQHMVAHRLLIRWGLWCNSRSSGSSLASAEALYSGKGMMPPSTAPLGADPAVMAVERAMIRMPMEYCLLSIPPIIHKLHLPLKRKNMPKRIGASGLPLKLLYAWRWSPTAICAALVPRVRPEEWTGHIHKRRAMVINLMRRYP
jgi:hypothetical protein